MRNAWRALSLRSLSRLSSCSSHVTQHGSSVLLVRSPESQGPSFLLPSLGRSPSHSMAGLRWFSSVLAVDHKDNSDHAPAVAAEQSKPLASPDEIKAQVESLNVSFDPETLDLVLGELGSLHLVREGGGVRLNSKAFNRMLEILGMKGRSENFFQLMEIMKIKGFGMAKDTYLEVLKSFEELKMERDVSLLKEAYSVNSSQRNAIGRLCNEFCKILRGEGLDDTIRKELNSVDFVVTSDVVVAVLERIGQYPHKALLFFDWLELNPSFKMDSKVYNAMARILAREEFIEKFWDILRKNRNQGHVLEKETIVKVLDRFYNRKIIAEAVNFYEFAMDGSEKPSPEDFLFLLKKIVVSKVLDFNMIKRVVQTYMRDGNPIKGSVFPGVLKSLRSVQRLGECNKILKAMEEEGFVADSSVHDRVVIGLCDAERMDEALEYLDNKEKEGYSLEISTWIYLLQKHSLAGKQDQALACLNKMIERRGRENFASAFEVLVKGFSQKDKVKEVYKIMKETVTKLNVRPSQNTYKFLIDSLIKRGFLKEASGLLELMRKDGFQLYTDPFIGYISKYGTMDDAMCFLNAMAVKEFNSKSVFVHIFKKLLRAGRHEVAHEMLSKSPGCIRNHADVLDLFYSLKPAEVAKAVA